MRVKPSEYIAVGCLQRPKQAIKAMFLDDDASCAFGALIEGYGIAEGTPRHDENVLVLEAKKAMPWLIEMRWIPCPVCGIDDRSVVNGILHLNDLHGWSREKIGAWLDRFASTNKTPETEQREEAERDKTSEIIKRAEGTEPTTSLQRDAESIKTPEPMKREEEELVCV